MATFDDLAGTQSSVQGKPLGAGASFDDLARSALPPADAEYSPLYGAAQSIIGQGMLFGFGDEIMAGLRSLGSSKSYGDLLEAERKNLKTFRERNPVLSTAGELAGGFATPGLGLLGGVVRGGRGLASNVARGAGVGAGLGVAGTFAAGEGGEGTLGEQFSNRMEGAGGGAALGGLIGAAIPVAGNLIGRGSRAIDRAAQDARDHRRAAELYFADKLAGSSADDVPFQLQKQWADLRRGQQAADFGGKGKTVALPETIADLTPDNQRTLRGIKVGGGADDVIEPFLASRQSGDIDFARGGEAGGQFGRINEGMRLAMRVSDEPLADRLEKMASKRGKEADELFGKAFAKSEEFNLLPTLQAYTLQAMNLGPEERAKLVRAVKYFNPTGYTGEKIFADAEQKLARMDARIAKLQARPMRNTGPERGVVEDGTRKMAVERLLAERADLEQRLSEQVAKQLESAATQSKLSFGVNTVERFQRAKEQLDDLIGESQGNMKRLLTGLKNDVLNEVLGRTSRDASATRNAPYAEALQKYASRSEIMDAAEAGQKMARGTETITAKQWAAMSEPEKNAARAGWLDVMRGKMGDTTLGPTTDFTRNLRKPSTGDDLRLMLPPRAGESAQFPGGNREKLGELVRREARISDTSRKVLGNSTTAEKAVDAIDIGKVARMFRYVRDQGGITQAVVGGLSDALERISAIKGPRARYLAEQLLSTNPAAQQAFLERVQRAYGDSAVRTIADQMTRFTPAIQYGAASKGGQAVAESHTSDQR